MMKRWVPGLVCAAAFIPHLYGQAPTAGKTAAALTQAEQDAIAEANKVKNKYGDPTVSASTDGFQGIELLGIKYEGYGVGGGQILPNDPVVRQLKGQIETANKQAADARVVAKNREKSLSEDHDNRTKDLDNQGTALTKRLDDEEKAFDKRMQALRDNQDAAEKALQEQINQSTDSGQTSALNKQLDALKAENEKNYTAAQKEGQTNLDSLNSQIKALPEQRDRLDREYEGQLTVAREKAQKAQNEISKMVDPKYKQIVDKETAAIQQWLDAPPRQ